MPDSKVCLRCGLEKPISEFSRSGNGYKRWCGECRKTATIVRKYGRDVYKELFKKQNGVCATCGKPETVMGFGKNGNQRTVPDRLSIDHDHETGQFRGLLCRRCNYLTGVIEANLMLLPSVLEYLEEELIQNA